MDNQRIITLLVPARLRRTGMEMRLLIEGAGGGARREPDRSLLRLLARAQSFNTLMLEARGRTMRDLADAAGVTASYFTRVLRLSFLEPGIVKMIMQGQQPPQLTANRLISRSDLAPIWSDQAARLGIA
jgi:site-specific DNA recombinase